MMLKKQEAGSGVEAVRAALKSLASGSGEYADVLSAVKAAVFAVPPSARSLKELGEQWDYQEAPDTFRDSVESAFWSGIIDADQLAELRSSASFGAIPPSRQAE